MDYVNHNLVKHIFWGHSGSIYFCAFSGPKQLPRLSHDSANSEADSPLAEGAGTVEPRYVKCG